MSFYGSDRRLGTQVGKRTGKNIESIGEAGYLIFGPYIAMSAGNYKNFLVKITPNILILGVIYTFNTFVYMKYKCAYVLCFF
jgi:hypothetical protein